MDAGNDSASNWECAIRTFDGVSDWNWIIRIVCLCVTLFFTVASNLFLLVRLPSNSNKFSSSLWLLKAIALLGLLNSVVNIGFHLSAIVAGRWMLGEVACQVGSLMSCLLVSSWLWALVIGVTERYIKLVCLSNHPSLFSEVNTRIIIWGVILLLLILYLSPAYGWGEYSTFRGHLKIVLSLGNSSLSTSRFPNATTTSMSFPQLFSSLPNNTMLDMMSHLEVKYSMTTRPLHPVSGITLAMRFYDPTGLSCFWEDYVSGDAENHLSAFFKGMVTSTGMVIRSISLQLHILPKDLESYRQMLSTYQGDGLCGLDYSNTNKHIYSFVVLSWLCILAIPIQIVVYLHIRLKCFAEQDTTHMEPSSEGDNVLRRYINCFFFAFICSLPFFLSNLLSGLGYNIPYEAFFTFYLLMYNSWNIPLVLWKWEGSCDLPICHVNTCCAKPNKGSSFRLTTTVLSYDDSSCDSNGVCRVSPRESSLLISTTTETQVQAEETAL